MDTIDVITLSSVSHNALKTSPAMDEPRSRGALMAGMQQSRHKLCKKAKRTDHAERSTPTRLVMMERSTVDLVEVSIEMDTPLPHKATSHG